MRLLNFIIIVLCIALTQNVLANSLICSDYVKAEVLSQDKKEIIIDELDIQINPIQDTNKSYISFKFHHLIDNSGPEFAINLNLNNFKSPFSFDYVVSNNGTLSATLSPIENRNNTIFIDLNMRFDITETEFFTKKNRINITGLMQCKWTQPPQQMR